MPGNKEAFLRARCPRCMRNINYAKGTMRFCPHNVLDRATKTPKIGARCAGSGSLVPDLSKSGPEKHWCDRCSLWKKCELIGGAYFCDDCVDIYEVEKSYQENFSPPERLEKAEENPVDHPFHYTSHPSGVECIEITEHMNFCLGNAFKYIWRAGLKTDDSLKDLQKAKWYIEREIARLEDG